MDVQTKLNQASELLQKKRFLRPRDLTARGLPTSYLAELESRGLAQRVARGVYMPVDLEDGFPDDLTLSLVAQRIPQGVICLLTALRFHEIGVQNPHEVWLAVGLKDWLPKMDYPPLRVVKMSEHLLSTGVMEQRDESGQLIRVFNPAKTVADCFKFRNKIGVEVAIEALREGWRDRRFTMDELLQYAELCRVHRVMQPYLESLQS